MKIRKLTIHNIASIGDAVLDFTASPLANAPLFLITGSTGSGKSTILDAICLALYGTTPRFKSNRMDGKVDEINQELSLDDTRQLLRRGTAEGFVELDFTGSDAKEYNIRWSVARAHNNVAGKLQKVQRVLTRPDDDFVLEKVKEIDQFIPQATGLDLDQFCRTTMLAQGEFTRFLNSDDKEKSAILEKLTGVDIYSRIGAAVYDAYKKAENDYNLVMAQLDNTVLLSDEQIAELTGRLEQLGEEVKTLQTERDRRQKLVTAISQLAEAQKQLAAADNELPQLCKRAVTVSRHQLWMQEQLPAARKAAEEAAEARDRHKTEIKQAQTKVDEQTSLVDSYGRSDLITRQTELTALVTRCQAVATLQNNLSEARKNLETKRDELEKSKKELEKLEESLPALKATKEDAELVHKLASRAYKAQCDTVDDFARNMRAKLTVGQDCPVCRQRIIDALPSEADLEALVKRFEEAEEAARKKETKAIKALTSAETSIENGKKTCESKQSEIDNDRTVPQALENLTKACGDIGIPDNAPDLNAAANKAAASFQTDLNDIKTKIEAADEAQRVKDALTKNLLKLQAEASKLDKTATNTANAAKALEEEINDNATDIATLHRDLQLAATPTDPLAMTADSKLSTLVNKLDSDVKVWQASVKTARELLDRRRTELNELLPQTTDGESEIPDAAQLTEDMNELDAQINDKSTTVGVIRNQLDMDKANRQNVLQLQTQAEEKRRVKELHASLQSVIGSSDGAVFRKTALSYLLGHLVDQANSHLHSLTDRYTLKVKPGSFVISIEDAYQSYATRPATTLSGGESFMVSLALALALSDIGGRLQVDVLFIDEGFGTLSGDPLMRAIDTLRSLQRRAGRRVGIISHVAELRDNVDTQIHVDRPDGSSLATVTVC